jgi:hypothetical protein
LAIVLLLCLQLSFMQIAVEIVASVGHPASPHDFEHENEPFPDLVDKTAKLDLGMVQWIV